MRGSLERTADIQAPTRRTQHTSAAANHRQPRAIGSRESSQLSAPWPFAPMTFMQVAASFVRRDS